MTIKTWLDNSIQDADRRGLAPVRPLLESLARATSALRTADWNYDSSGEFDWPDLFGDTQKASSSAVPTAEADRSTGASAEADGR